jgi:hypothetical protein
MRAGDRTLLAVTMRSGELHLRHQVAASITDGMQQMLFTRDDVNPSCLTT